jgi:excisionase family DNA binding protein
VRGGAVRSETDVRLRWPAIGSTDEARRVSDQRDLLPPVEAMDVPPVGALPGLVMHLAALQAAIAARLAAAPALPARPPAARGPQSPNWLTVAEVASRLRKSTHTVRRMLQRGAFPGTKKMDSQWRIPLAGVQTYEGTGGSS